MPPKIAIVLPPSENFSPAASGAISLVVHRLALASAGEFSAVVIGPRVAFAPFDDVVFHPVPRAFWPPGSRAMRYATSVGGALRGLAPDMIEVHNRPDVALRLASRFRSLPVLLFLNNDPQAMRGSRSVRERRHLLASLKRVITASRYLRTRFLQGVEAGDGAVVLPNPIACNEIPRGSVAAAREPLVLFAGRMVADKGADSFVAAAAEALPRLRGWRAEMFGADRFGPASPMTPYLAALSRHAHEHGVVLHGYRPHDEVLRAMARAAIVVVPSRWAEPFGLAALEAMATGAALITSRRGALPEVAADAACYVDPDDPGELAARIISLAHDVAAREALRIRGQARALAFDLPRIATALGAIRREALAR